MPNLGAAIWRTILNIKLLCYSRCVPELLLSHLPKFIEFLPMHLNVIIENVSWLHFSWATLQFLIYRRDNNYCLIGDNNYRIIIRLLIVKLRCILHNMVCCMIMCGNADRLLL